MLLPAVSSQEQRIYFVSLSISFSSFPFFLHLTLLLKENPVCLYLFWHMVSMSCFSLRVAHHVLINSMSNNYSLSRRESITKTQLQSPRSGWAVEPPLVAGGRAGDESRVADASIEVGCVKACQGEDVSVDVQRWLVPNHRRRDTNSPFTFQNPSSSFFSLPFSISSHILLLHFSSNIP